ncbi:MAG: hypothetical protein ABIS50_25700 [Luteolibacter sp.]|uniref:hypothetical protein n=1 Tax=Luteolibacter sp. TaxID=1962973 RepID=UPI003263CC38
MARRTRLATVFTSLILAVAASAGDFIRVDEDDSAARLQTAVTRYEKDGESVELLGAVHIADKAYYETLTTRFQGYDSLLFEMIGGEKYTPRKDGEEGPAKDEGKNLSGLHKIYDMVAGFLNLTGQAGSIDYTTKNFVHADLTIAEFTEMQSERGESLIGFAMKAGKLDPDAKNQPDPAKLLKALLSGSSNGVKLEIVHTLGHGDDQIAAFAGESVIISDRNKRCLEVMNTEFAAGHKNLGIFYGAAHFPDMEKHLLELGFKRTKQEWLTAWNIPKAAQKPANDLKDAP